MRRIPQRPPRGYQSAVDRLHGPAGDRAARRHFDELSGDEKAEAVRRMAAQGYSDDTIATASGISREMVRRVLSKASS